MAEQLRLDQRVGEGGAIHRHERPLAAACVMGIARELLLAGAGLATDQDRQAPCGTGCDIAKHRHHGRIVGNECCGRARRHGEPRHLANTDQQRHRSLAWQVLDRRDHDATDAVLQALLLVAGAAVDHGGEAGPEQVVEMPARRGGQALQQESRLRIGAEHGAVRRQRQQPRAQGVQVFAAVVEGDDQVTAVGVAEQAVLHLGRGHADQRAGMLLPRAALRRRIEDADEAAIRSEDRRRRAGQAAVAGKEVLAAMHRQRPPDLPDRAKRVGAAPAFGPERSSPDVGVASRRPEALVGNGVEQDAVGVGESDQKVRACDLAVERLHLGKCQAAHQVRLLARDSQFAPIDLLELHRVMRIESGLDATRPARGNVRRQQVCLRNAVALERNPCLTQLLIDANGHRIPREPPPGRPSHCGRHVEAPSDFEA